MPRKFCFSNAISKKARTRIPGFLSAVLVLAGFAVNSHETRAQSGCLMAAPIPCPPVAEPEWWIGAWATRMRDSSGVGLTGFTMLRPGGAFKSTLEYDDGRKVEEWGRYEIRFPRGAKSFKKTSVEIREEAQIIERSVEKSSFSKTSRIVNLMAAPIPAAERFECDCATGEIIYHVEGSSPSDLEFVSPQVFRFVEQAPGYVRVWGEGAGGRLSRRYSE